MKPIEINPANIYGEDFLDLSNNYLQQLEASIELMRRGDINGVAFSNNGFGWQSDMLPHVGPFETLTQKIVSSAYEFCKNMNMTNLSNVSMLSLWANINYTKDINWPHQHAGDISGVYYIKAPKDCGTLNLLSFQYTMKCPIQYHLKRKHEVSIEAVKDKLILFDSNLVHMVNPNNSKEPRISVSFNLKINEDSATV